MACAIYRAGLTVEGPISVPWTADTIFGHICWAVRDGWGEGALKALLDMCRAGDPPFVLSDALPGDMLPKPATAEEIFDRVCPATERASLPDRLEKLSGRRFLPPACFDALRRGEIFDVAALDAAGEPAVVSRRLARAAVDRARGRLVPSRAEALVPIPAAVAVAAVPAAPAVPAPQAAQATAAAQAAAAAGAAGQVDTQADANGAGAPEGTAGGAERDSAPAIPNVRSGSGAVRYNVYIKAKDDWTDRLDACFKTLSVSGMGGGLSIGMGRFNYIPMERFRFAPVEKANGFVSLSHFVPAASDPTEGAYGLKLKRGRVGGCRSGRSPFKRPLLMLESGSCFMTGSEPAEFYGRVVEDIAPDYPGVVQVCFAFAVPMRLPWWGGGGARRKS
ncbi:MAG: hypothetical protein N3A38_00560 [Planctomycetota bacterium]|nr:hypothetical protein [Planctomycetota bacterium]